MEINLCYGCMREKKEEGPCPYCGFDVNTYRYELHQLPPGTVLNGKYLTGKVLGEGGFGITYLGWDLNLEIKVAIKEYFPNGFVTRNGTQGCSVTMLTGSRLDYYRKGREKFVTEAKRLAKFWGMPGIVAVKDYFQENGTAYIVMEFVEGKTLKQLLKENDGRMEPQKVIASLLPVMDSLKKMHEAGLIHRDISPDNLMVDEKGDVKLIDFGAARSYFAEEENFVEKEKSLTVMLKPGFAPMEQYHSRGNQGPWTDVYALSATIYAAITGEVPPESLDRLEEDTLKQPSELGCILEPEQEKALLKGLSIRSEDRFQDMAELRDAIKRKEISKKAETENSKEKTQDTSLPKDEKKTKKEKLRRVLICAAVAAVAVSGVWLMSQKIKENDTTEMVENTTDQFSTETEQETETVGAAGYTWSDEEGNVFTVTQINSDTTGKGIIELINGNRYEGEVTFAAERDKNGNLVFEVGNINGKGVCTYSPDDSEKRDRYEGEWENGKRNGQGTLIWQNGNKYEGEWKDGAFNGKGSFYFKSGERFEGEFLNNKKNGQGQYYNAEGRICFDGNYVDGARSGIGICYHDDGVYHINVWQNDKEEGYGIWYNSEGNILYEGEWKDGELISKTEITDEPIIWSDQGFEKCVRAGLGLTEEQTITAKDLEKVEVLVIHREMYDDGAFASEILVLDDFNEYNTAEPTFYDDICEISIRSIEDLQYFPNLRLLEISGFEFENIEPVSRLLTLDILNLNNSEIRELSAIADLSNLKNLSVSQTDISDISPIAGLKNLQVLNISGTEVEDISAIEGLNNLSYLFLNSTKITDISSVADLKKLKTLFIGHTNVTDISPVSELEDLQELSLQGTKITDITALSKLTNLQYLNLEYTEISDISALSDLLNLEELHLMNTNITDVSCLDHLKNLQLF